MRYLAILGYDCGCFSTKGYGCIKNIGFTSRDEGELEKKLEEFKRKLSEKENGHICAPSPPAEVLIFDEHLTLVRQWRRK